MRGRVVVVLGENSLVAGKLVAERLGLPLVCSIRVSLVDPTLTIVAVVACYEDLSYDDLDQLYSERASGDDAAYLLLARSQAELVSRCGSIFEIAPAVEGQAARLRLTAPQSRERRLDVEKSIASTKSAPALYMATMSDGLDAYLGYHSLCGLKDQPQRGSVRDQPFCILTNYCYREDSPLPRALASDALIAPTALAAPFIFLAGCWGLLPGDAVESASYSILEGWLATGRVRCVITTWELTIGDLGCLESVFAKIARGMPPTKAIVMFNRSPMAVATGTRLCIVGVPHAVEGFDSNYAPPNDSEYEGTPARVDCKDAPRAFLRAYAARVLSQEPAPLNRDDWLFAFQAASEPDVLDDVDGQSAFARAVARLSTTGYSYWMRMAVPETAIGRVPCPNCDTLSPVLSIVCASKPLSRRIVIKCPRCGIALDRDPLSPVKGIALTDNLVRIAVEPAIGNYSVWVTTEQFVGSGLKCWELDHGRHHVSELQFLLDRDQLIGVRWVSITVLSDWRLTVARLPVSRALRCRSVKT